MYNPYLRHLREIAEWSCHTPAMKQSVCRLLCSVSNWLFTQLLALVHTVSKCLTPAAYPKCRPCSGCPSWLSFITVIVQAHASWLPEIKLYENLTYAPHAVNSYHFNLQRQGYKAQSTPDNIWKFQFDSLVWGSLMLTQLLTSGQKLYKVASLPALCPASCHL